MTDITAYQERLTAFFSVLAQKLQSHREAMRHLDRFLCTGFNVFAFIGPDENKLSDIIANLLDPRGTHGQERLFLDRFLQLLGLSHLSTATEPRIVREDSTRYISTSGRRLDLTLHFDKFGIGIENKPWAIDQQDQLLAYYEHLRLKYSGDFCLVYITRRGLEPDPVTMPEALVQQELANQRLRLLSYERSIPGWLEECTTVCNSDKFRWFLRDFVDYIREDFPASPELGAVP